MITWPALFLVLIVGFVIWYRGVSDKEDLMKTQIFLENPEKFKELFGEKELQKMVKRSQPK